MTNDQIQNLYDWCEKAWDNNWINREEWYDSSEISASIQACLEGRHKNNGKSS